MAGGVEGSQISVNALQYIAVNDSEARLLSNAG